LYTVRLLFGHIRLRLNDLIIKRLAQKKADTFDMYQLSILKIIVI